jgi:hypothetical protein
MTYLAELVNLEQIKKLVKADLDKSGIDEETQSLNFAPIYGKQAFELAYPDARQLNNMTMPRGWARKFHKVEDFFGWCCGDRMRWLGGSPYRDEQGNPKRYISSMGRTTPITFINPGRKAIRKAEARFGVPKPPEMDYWDWVKVYGLPVVITEGEKKAAALICQGIPAIALPGIFTGFRAVRDDWGKVLERLLREELLSFDTAGRSICIMFDHRPGVGFEITVEFKAAAILSRQFSRATVRIAELPGPHKGADDYIAAGEFEVVEQALRDAKTASQYEHTRLWKEYRKFTATGEKTRDYFFDAPEPKPGTLTVVRSNLNSGKSEWAANKIAKVQKVEKNGKVRTVATADGVMGSIGHRNSLQEQLCDRWDFDHLDLHNAYGRFSDPNLRVALCFDSLLKLPPDIFNGATVILDESMTGIKHLLTSSTLRGKRLEILQRFEYIVRMCSRIILMDGNMSDWLVDYVAAVDPTKVITKYDNESDRPTPPLYFVDDDSVTKKQVDEWINLQILEAKLPAVVVDSIVKAEAIAQQLTKLKGDGLLITSKTVTEKWVREFLKDPDTYINKYPTRVNWIVCTPTVESGVTINNKGKFDTVFCWFVGVVGINEAVQMSRRVRNPDRVIVFAPKVGIDHKRNSGAFEQILMEDLGTRIAAEAGVFAGSLGDKVVETLKAQLDSPHIKAWAKMQAIEYLENRNYREFLYLAFESMGMKPQRVQAYQVDSEAYKSAKLEVQLVECQQIFNAPDITDKQAEDLGKKIDSNWEERCTVLKHKLLQRLPGLRDSPLWSADFVHRIRYRERTLSSQLELFWLLTHPDESEALKAQQWADKTDVDFFIPDRVGSDRWLFVKIMHSLGFHKFLDGHVYTDQSAEVIEFVRVVRWKKTISRIVGHPGHSTNLTFINRTLMPLFGIKPVKKQVRMPVVLPGVEGTRLYTYWYDRAQSHPDNWDELLGYVDRRFQQRLSKDSPEIYQGDRPTSAPDDVPEPPNHTILPQTQIQGFEKDKSSQSYTMPEVTGFDINYKFAEQDKTEPEFDPKNEENGARSAGNGADGGIEAEGSQTARLGEEGQKHQDLDLLTVWVQTNCPDRPKIEEAKLLNCEFEGFSVSIKGEVWLIPCDDLYWTPPEPS